ncbi:hypothetical protein CALVIDRAFT_533563 [Calocera viscosa TUFC12733]|uniref:TOM13-domain-containing protein n=1 Tax=Calocera viscosa (strain TUFC12733) TaxID=1330018 RepID=A0A167R537_CALVF|nr:hypothetical protein CALVIDRAFT_533563 [Calocera viscosa TUFC12733]
MAAEDLASSGYLDPLREALDSSFTSSDPSLRAPEPVSEAHGSSAVGETPIPAQQDAPSGDAAPADDGWKAEYDERLAAWRAEAAVARQKAEEERARWAAIRDAERAAGESRRREERAAEERRGRESALSSGEWDAAGSSAPAVSGSAAESSNSAQEGRDAVTRARLGEALVAAEVEVLAVPLEGSDGEPSVVDARDLTTSEPEGTGHMFSSMQSDFPSVVSLGSTPPTIPSLFQTDTDSAVEVSNGEDKSSPDADESSLNESAPSRRRPGASRPTASASAAAAAAASAQAAQNDEKRTAERDAKAVAAAAEVPKSLALSVFSPGLPWRARLLALAGTLAINLALPFVNGVMLGFGEIFAKNYIAVWIGWSRRPKGAATAVGVRY